MYVGTIILCFIYIICSFHCCSCSVWVHVFCTSWLLSVISWHLRRCGTVLPSTVMTGQRRPSWWASMRTYVRTLQSSNLGGLRVFGRNIRTYVIMDWSCAGSSLPSSSYVHIFVSSIISCINHLPKLLNMQSWCGCMYVCTHCVGPATCVGYTSPSWHCLPPCVHLQLQSEKEQRKLKQREAYLNLYFAWDLPFFRLCTTVTLPQVVGCGLNFLPWHCMVSLVMV